MLGESRRSGLVYILFCSKATQCDSGQVLVETHFAHQFVTAAVRQSDVADQQIEILCAHFLYCLVSGMRYGNFVTTTLQHPFHTDASVMMIIDQQDSPMLCDGQFSLWACRLVLLLSVGASRRDHGV